MNIAVPCAEFLGMIPQGAHVVWDSLSHTRFVRVVDDGFVQLLEMREDGNCVCLRISSSTVSSVALYSMGNVDASIAFESVGRSGGRRIK